MEMEIIMKHGNYYKTFLALLFWYSIRMSSKNMIFDDRKINKSNFHETKKVIQRDNVHLNKILISKIESYGEENSFKHFIGYNDNDNRRQLSIRLPQMIGYAKYFDRIKPMLFKVNDKKNC